MLGLKIMNSKFFGYLLKKLWFTLSFVVDRKQKNKLGEVWRKQRHMTMCICIWTFFQIRNIFLDFEIFGINVIYFIQYFFIGFRSVMTRFTSVWTCLLKTKNYRTPIRYGMHQVLIENNHIRNQILIRTTVRVIILFLHT